ncbi:MAG: helicase-related protein [Rubrivivax sp.]
MTTTVSAATAAAPVTAYKLPTAAHAARLPPHIGVEHMARIRAASFSLPQVVKPADFVSDGSAGFEKHLDGLGYVLLQKPSPPSRPSRWIAPGLIDTALLHLDEVGTGAEARPTMLKRRDALEGIGITFEAGLWSRRVSQSLPLSEPDWKVQVHYRLAVAGVAGDVSGTASEPASADALWRYFRDGDLLALQAALGVPLGYPHAAELMAHLEALLARSRALFGADDAADRARHLPLLLPRLQAECAAPQPIAALAAACTRAQDRWEHQVTEASTLQGLNAELAFHGYPDSFALARSLHRKVTLFVGPPNSGKTHAAFERLASLRHEGAAGAYLAPLRLLALEGRDRLVARGVPCSLLTGEENVPAPGARAVSSTIEMVRTQDRIDVAVIDEAQMIFDNSRGWAWTQAIVGVPAAELIIICSDYAVPAIENLLGLCGERCTVRHFGRKQHVQLLPAPVAIGALKLGDAVVAFSRRDVLTLRDAIAAGGHPVSVIYGALPPEVRRREAERFASGESHILVATDAIGMGLNLPIRRVLFSTLTKFDGIGDRRLQEGEVHQIAGRAGRFGIHEEGFVGVLDEAEPEAAQVLSDLLDRTPRAPADFKAPVAPNGWHIDTISARLHKRKLREVLAVFVEQLRLDDAHFAVAALEQMLDLAEQIDRVASTLTLRERFVYAQAPVDTRTDTQVQAFLDWGAAHAHLGHVGRPWFLDEVDSHSRLERMEHALRSCTLWLWLDLRFPGIYGHLDEVIHLRSRLNDGIELQLKGKRPLAQLRQRQRSAARRPGPAGARG